MDVNWNDVEPVEGEGGGAFIKFNEIGQSTVGIFTGFREVEGRFGAQTVLDFNGYDGGEPFSLNANPDLKRKMKKLVPGNLVRVEYVEDLDVGKDSPMKVFKVQQAPAQQSLSAPARRSGDDIPF